MPVAVITGANRGLGLEFVHQHLNEGWTVYALNRGTSDAIEALADTKELQIFRGDLTDPGVLTHMAQKLEDVTIDRLINNAGAMGDKSFRVEDKQKQGLHDFNRDEWRDIFELNVFTPVHLVSLLRSNLAPEAQVVTLSSSMGSISGNEFGGWYAYRSSKAAVNSIMKSMSLELDEGVLSVALHPGWVRTDMGSAAADIDPVTSIQGMMKVLKKLGPEDNGAFIGYDGTRLEY